MGEREIVARLKQRFPHVGDDAAVLGEEVVTNDMLIENVDFTRAVPLALIARKSLAVNLSDLAAMGATPTYALVAVGAPEWVDLDAFFDALADAARAERIEIVGGDLSRAEQLIISITAMGRASRPLLRGGAKRGDRVYLSRPIGGSATGLHLLQQGWSVDGDPPPGPRQYSYVQREFAASCIRRHVDPAAEVELGMTLARIAEVSACIDLSDGLSTDLAHLCDASNVGADIERERIPMLPDLLGSGTSLGIRAQDVVLHGGEEYALLFTSSLRESEMSARAGRPLYAIGRISGERGVRLNGEPLAPGGYDHFA